MTAHHARAHEIHQNIRRLRWVLMAIWLAVSFGWTPFARDFDFPFFSWKFNFWMAAHGSLFVFLLMTVINAWLVNRWEKELAQIEEERINEEV